MKKIVLLAVFCLPVFSVLGQNAVDTLSFWHYHLEPHTKTEKDKSIGQLTFWRTKPVHDSVHMSLHQELWTPQITFAIYPLADSVNCIGQSKKIKMTSSCMGPDIGGDMYQVGNFILLNRDICLSCVAYVTKWDYCRPVITKLLDAMDKRKVKSLQDLEKQLTVKKGDVKNLMR